LLYSLWLNRNILKHEFAADFEPVLNMFQGTGSIRSASDQHEAVRKLVTSRLLEVLSEDTFVDFVNKRCLKNKTGKCSEHCDCPFGRCVNERKGACDHVCQCPTLEEISKGTVTGVLAALIHSLMEELGNGTSYKRMIYNISLTDAKLKCYSGSSCVLMAFEMLKPYCSCVLVTVYFTEGNAGRIELPSTDQVDGRLSAFIVFEHHGTTSPANHYQLLVPTLQTDPGICISPELSCTIMKIMNTARTARSSTGVLNVEGASPRPRQAQAEVVDILSENDEPLTVLRVFLFVNKPLSVRQKFFNKVVGVESKEIHKWSGIEWLGDKQIDVQMAYMLFLYTESLSNGTNHDKVLTFISFALTNISEVSYNPPAVPTLAERFKGLSWAIQVTLGEKLKLSRQLTLEPEKLQQQLEKLLDETTYFLHPFNLPKHWSLLIICNPGEVLKKRDFGEVKKKEACILYVDSLLTSTVYEETVLTKPYQFQRKDTKWTTLDLTLEQCIYKLLNHVFCGDNQKLFNSSTMPIFVIKVPQQSNSYQCGVHVLKATQQFLAYPDKDKLVQMLKNGEMGNWFSEQSVQLLRKEFHELWKVYEKANNFTPSNPETSSLYQVILYVTSTYRGYC